MQPSKVPSRGDQYKRRTDLDGARHARQEVHVQIRKDRTRELVQAKRVYRDDRDKADEHEDTSMIISPRTETNYAAAMAEIMSGDAARALAAMREIRKSVSIGTPKENGKAITLAVETTGLVELIVRVLADPSATPEHRFEAAWITTNLASGDTKCTQAVVDANAVHTLVNGIVFGDILLRQQCVWALGNIAGDSVDMRKLVVHSGALEAMYTSLDGIIATRFQTTFDLYHDTLDNYAWTAYNIVRGTGSRMWMSADAIKALAIVERVARGVGLDDIDKAREDAKANLRPTRARYAVDKLFSNVAYCMSEIAAIARPDGTELANDVRAAMQSMNLVSAVVRSAHFPSGAEKTAMPELHTACVMLCGNLVASTNDENSDAMLAAGIVPAIVESLNNPHLSLRSRREMCWIVSNLAAGTPHQVRAVATRDVFSALALSLACGSDSVSKEVAWALCNMVTSESETHCDTNRNLLPDLARTTPGFLTTLGKAMMEKQDLEFLLRSIEAVSGMLALEKKTGSAEMNGNALSVALDESGVLDALEDLTVHTSEDVQHAAGMVIDTFFGEDVESYDY